MESESKRRAETAGFTLTAQECVAVLKNRQDEYENRHMPTCPVCGGRKEDQGHIVCEGCFCDFSSEDFYPAKNPTLFIIIAKKRYQKGGAISWRS